MEAINPQDVQQLKARLTEHGLKATVQRIVIYQTLLMSREHPTAERVYESIRTQHPSISLGTVYKTLDSLVTAGLARKVMSHDDILRFDANMHHHSHVYCTNTDKIIDYEDQELSALLEAYFAKRKFDNFRLTDFQLQINGEIIDRQKDITIL